jgi:hypothetical protein
MADRLTIQRLPTGLLDILGMQSTGDTPHSLEQSVSATLDTTELYLMDRFARRIEQTAVIAAAGTFIAGLPTATPLGPQPGEQWMLYGVTVTSTALAAATNISYVFSLSRTSLGGTQYLSSKQSVANPDVFGQGQLWERPMILRPGDQLGIAATLVTGAPAVAPFVQAFFVPIRI